MSDDRTYQAKWRTLAAMCLGLGLLMMDLFIVTVALPSIAQELGAELRAAEWTISGYALMLGVLPVAMGRLGDLFGRRRIYLWGLILFLLASLGSGMAWDITSLVVFRVVQGAGAAIMMPLTLTLITAAFPTEQRGLAIGIWGGISGLGLIGGPLLGGLLVEGGGWRWIFLINIPIVAVAFALTLLFVTESRDEDAPRRVDWAGVGLLTVGLFLLLHGLSRVSGAGWTDGVVLGSLGGGAALLAAFPLVELRVRAPLIDPALFRNRTFMAACASVLLFAAAVFGTQPFISLLMQNTWGFTPLESGLAFVPATVLVAAMMPLAGWLGQLLRSHLHLAIVAGALAVCLSNVFLLPMDTSSGYWDSLLPAFLIRGLGIGLFLTTSTFATMSAVSPAQAGLASGVLIMARQVGAALGIALLGTVYQFHVEQALPVTGGDLSPAVRHAAENFFAAGGAAVRPLAEEAIVGGFVQIAWATTVLAALATLAAFLIRHRPPQAAPSQAGIQPRESSRSGRKIAESEGALAGDGASG